MVDTQRAFQQVLVVSHGTNIIVTDLQGEVLAEHTRPVPGIKYVGNGPTPRPTPQDQDTVTEVLTPHRHQRRDAELSPMSWTSHMTDIITGPATPTGVMTNMAILAVSARIIVCPR